MVEAYVHILQCSYQVVNYHWLENEPIIKEMLLRNTTGYTLATKQENMKTTAFKPVGQGVSSIKRWSG